MAAQRTRRQWIFLDKVGHSLCNIISMWAVCCGSIGASTAGSCYRPVTLWGLCVHPPVWHFFVGTVLTKPDGVKKHFWTILLGTQYNSWGWWCVGLWVGFDDSWGFLPNQLTLWFCDLFSPTHAICFPQHVLSNSKIQTAFSYSKYPLTVCLLRCQPCFWAILQNPLCCWHWLAVLNMSCSTECLLCVSLPRNIWRR